MILIRCQCGRKLRLRPEYAGRVGKCPACGREVQVPKDLPSDGKGGSEDDSEPAASATFAAANPTKGTLASPGLASPGLASPTDDGPAASGSGADSPSEESLKSAATEMEIGVDQGAAAAYKRDREARKQAAKDRLAGPTAGTGAGRPPAGAKGAGAGRSPLLRAALPMDAPTSPGMPAHADQALSGISREAMTAREPMTAPREALDAWIKRPGTGLTPATGTEPVEPSPRDSLSLRGTAKGSAPPPARPGAARGSGAAGAGGPPAGRRDAKGGPPSQGAPPGKGGAPGSKAPGKVEKTTPLRAAATGPGAAGIPKTADRAIPKTAERTVQMAAPKGLEAGPTGPWYQNETFVLLLLMFCYPLGVAGIFLGSAWATRAQKGLAGLSAVGVAGLGAWLAIG